jgi:hypothetical protein
MVELSKKEYENLSSQFAASSWGGTRYAPMAFTEHSVLMSVPENAVICVICVICGLKRV